MIDYSNVLKRALEDPKLEGISCIYPRNLKLVEANRELPEDVCVSEWRYGMGEVRYDYHVHVNGVASELRRAFEEGVRGGHPWLTAIYSKKDLDCLTQESAVDSVS